MINIPEFTNRLKKVIEYYDESASSFAEKIGVQRSSISHLLSGRNKPSLDFVMKVLHTYPEVDLYWLMDGVGEFPKQEQLFKNKTPELDFENTTQPKPEHFKQNTKITVKNENSNAIDNTIEQIVVFYKDGTFKIYKP